jgi:hypothetical protein
MRFKLAQVLDIADQHAEPSGSLQRNFADFSLRQQKITRSSCPSVVPSTRDEFTALVMASWI